MTEESQNSNIAASVTRRQQLFIRYFTCILIDLAVLNLFDEYWDRVQIESFTISLLAAILLQTLLKITILLEHRVAAFFQSKSGKTGKLMRLLSA